MLSGCATSVPFASAQVNLAPLPAYVQGQGKTVRIPKGPLDAAGTKKLIIALRRSEVNNARAVRIAKTNHQYITNLNSQQVPSGGLFTWPGDKPNYAPINPKAKQYRGLLAETF